MKNIITLIPARGGSKGIPRKNLRLLNGKPLIVHSIEQSRKSSQVSLTVVSTDDDEIARVSEDAGAKVIRRPIDISGDTASSESALVHSLKVLQAQDDIRPELVVFLQCTSPVRRAFDIDNAISTFLSEEADSLLSVSPSHHFLWSRNNGQAQAINYDFEHRPRRQDMAPQFMENGSIYVFRTQGLITTGNRLSGKVALYEMDEEAAIDIDSMLDLQLAEIVMQHREQAAND